MNKKGFTLIEVLVSIGLLALLGTIIVVSLNKMFKDNNEKNYNEFVDKVKSAGMLYVNNTVDIINDLNKSSYRLIEINELINNGYINENLVNPNTGEKIGKNEKVKVSYNSDYELIIEYPYENKETEPYLYTLNYTIIYGDNTTSNLCYIGLNTSSLQLINPDGTPLKNVNNSNKLLTINSNIEAYLENGEKCTDNNLSSSKIGTYKIIYRYTKDYTKTITETNEIKTAERTITVKASKPTINTFKVINSNENDVYEATATINAKDPAKTQLQYCMIAKKANETPSISECSYTEEQLKQNNIEQNITDEQNKIFNRWIDLNLIKPETSNTFNIKERFPDFENESEIVFYVYVKNSFEEYEMKQMTYQLTNTLILNLNTNKGFTSDTKFYKNLSIDGKFSNELQSTIIIRNIENGTSFNKSFKNTDYGTSFTPLTREYYFDKWYYDNEFQKEVSNSDEIKGVVNVYAKWESDKTSPTCSITLGALNSALSATVTETKLYKFQWEGNDNIIKTGKTYIYNMVDNAGNTGNCSVNIKKITEETTCTSVRYAGCDNSSLQGRLWHCDSSGEEAICCYCASSSTSYICYSPYKNYNNSYCYKTS